MRLDKSRELELQPERMEYAIARLESLGKNIVYKDITKIQFFHKEKLVTLFPYSGWFSGKSVVDGRGIGKLLGQLK